MCVYVCINVHVHVLYVHVALDNSLNIYHLNQNCLMSKQCLNKNADHYFLFFLLFCFVMVLQTVCDLSISFVFMRTYVYVLCAVCVQC